MLFSTLFLSLFSSSSPRALHNLTGMTFNSTTSASFLFVLLRVFAYAFIRISSTNFLSSFLFFSLDMEIREAVQHWPVVDAFFDEISSASQQIHSYGEFVDSRINAIVTESMALEAEFPPDDESVLVGFLLYSHYFRLRLCFASNLHSIVLGLCFSRNKRQ